MERIKVNSLAHLKRLMQLGTEYHTPIHNNHPQYAGLVRVVTKVQTNCVYGKVKDQPEHPVSLTNHGLGLRTDFEKPGCYEFGETIKVYKTPEKKTLIYCTIPYEYNIPPAVWQKYVDTTLKEAIKKPQYKRIRLKEIVFGRAIAEALLDCGCQLKGVPGFFKVADRWCFRIVAGMLIPVRNHDGLIVGAQIRKDVGPTRYLTLSSKGLDGAVNVEISRAHFPIANQNDCGYAVITEGPLKAEVAAELNGGGCFISIPGVKATTPLEREYPWLKERGIKAIKNALDMDKLTNKNVREGSVQLTALLKKHGFKVSQLCWDEEYARQKLEELLLLCENYEIEIPSQVTEAQRAGRIFNAVALAATCLEDADIAHSVEMLPDGTTRKHYWSDATKGIDDYLLIQAQKR